MAVPPRAPATIATAPAWPRNDLRLIGLRLVMRDPPWAAPPQSTRGLSSSRYLPSGHSPADGSTPGVGQPLVAATVSFDCRVAIACVARVRSRVLGLSR